MRGDVRKYIRPTCLYLDVYINLKFAITAIGVIHESYHVFAGSLEATGVCRGVAGRAMCRKVSVLPALYTLC